MTSEETIKWLESLKAEIGKSEHRTLWHYAEAIDMAIEALSAEPNCKDCKKRNNTTFFMDDEEAVDMAIEALSAEAVRGEWQKVDEQPYFRKHFDNVCCSVCHHKGMRKYNYCPNCGAKMEK